MPEHQLARLTSDNSCGDRLLVENGEIGPASRDGRFLALSWTRRDALDSGSFIVSSASAYQHRPRNRRLAGLAGVRPTRARRVFVETARRPGDQTFIADASRSNTPPRKLFDSPDVNVEFVHDWSPTEQRSLSPSIEWQPAIGMDVDGRRRRRRHFEESSIALQVFAPCARVARREIHRVCVAARGSERIIKSV